VIEQKKQWLMGVTWDSILSVNRNLCLAQKVEAATRPKPLAAAQAVWEKAARQPLTLAEVFDACRACCELTPFVFNNGNTFAAVGRTVIEEHLKLAPPVEAQILRTTVGHYIAGTVNRRELCSVLSQLSRIFSQTPAAPRQAPAASASVAAPAMTEARPVA
jgi:hypothetical protein